MLVLELLQLAHDLSELSLSLFLLNRGLADSEHSLLIHEIARAWSSSELAVDTFPMLLEVRLNVLKPVESGHLTWLLGRCLRGGLPIKTTLNCARRGLDLAP